MAKKRSYRKRESTLVGIHQAALKEFDAVQGALRGERKQCLDDRRFYSIAGAQWEGEWAQHFENKPKFEINKIHLSVIRIINEYRNNRITVDFHPADGSKKDDLADMCDGLYRADELDSSAEEAYDNAFEEAVGGGFGAWRLIAEEEDDEDPENENQRIRFEPIYDADTSVYFDLQAKKQDKSDAKRCWVLTSMTPEAFEEEYDDDPVTWPKSVSDVEFDWYTGDVVYVAEYYEMELGRETIHIWQTLTGEEEQYTDEQMKDEELIKKLRATGSKKVRTRKLHKRRVHKYIMSGGKILEDCGYIAGKCIPIVPVYGKRWFVDNVERCMGHVRLGRDVQCIKNMQYSKLGEISALGSVEKPIVTPEQIAGHKTMWAEDNVKNYPYLLLNSITDQNGNEVASGPIGFTKAPEIPPALAALLELSENDLQDVLGNNQNPDEMMPNISGIAVELIQTRLDMQTYIYMSNMAKAVKRSGQIWLSMAKDIFVEEGRKMKTVGSQNEIDQIILLEPKLDDDGKEIFANDFSQAKMDVYVDVGPSSTSRRNATVRVLSEMASLTDDPETKQVLTSMAMMNMEGEGISEVRDYFRQKLIKMGVVKPTEEEATKLQEELANTPPSPQDQYFTAAAAKEQTEAEKNQVETLREQAETDKVRAETQEILGKLNLDKLRALVEVVEKLGPRVIPDALPQQSSNQLSNSPTDSPAVSTQPL